MNAEYYSDLWIKYVLPYLIGIILLVIFIAFVKKPEQTLEGKTR